jgi:hypothetical protein
LSRLKEQYKSVMDKTLERYGVIEESQQPQYRLAKA